MASATGIQTRDTHKERKVVIKGDALMTAGDDVLVIEIPAEDQPPTGRTSQIRWQVRIVEKPA
ncbi:hypothetical protein LCGC14_0836220 [marine sediment metagenome]|uniref:Uncharacterized protein n=1 Tax=marine sediment metagenome TaxID=412755 RepID=A0A0F9RZ65_9ZZZZ